VVRTIDPRRVVSFLSQPRGDPVNVSADRGVAQRRAHASQRQSAPFLAITAASRSRE